MLAFEVEFLFGRSVSTDRTNRQRAEWPPHPGRLFSALVSALKDGPFGKKEREALLWLETLPSPGISCGQKFDRSVLTTYVPVNDVQAPRLNPKKPLVEQGRAVQSALEVLPERRPKKERFFPSVTLQDPQVFFIWECNPEDLKKHRAHLENLASFVTYLGHSSSLVKVGLSESPPPAVFRHSEDGGLFLRVPTPGRLEHLEMLFQSDLRPDSEFYTRYEIAGEEISTPPTTGSVFGEVLMFRKVAGQEIGLADSAFLAEGIRNALMDRADQPPLDVLSGHHNDGSPLTEPHLAIIPLPDVGHRFADGHLLGFGLVLPRTISLEERRHIFRALEKIDAGVPSRLEEIRLGKLGVWKVERLNPTVQRKAFDLPRYQGPAKVWGSVTPVVLDKFPKKKPGRGTEDLLRKACVRIGLPEPVEVGQGTVSPFRGVPAVTGFPPFRRKVGGVRPQIHAIIRFDREVTGPLILGAGRYFGQGLFLPIVGHFAEDGRT